jgi:peptidylprolyl isomerase
MRRSLVIAGAVALSTLAGCGSSTPPAGTPAPAESSAAEAPAPSSSPIPSVAGVPALTGNPTDVTKQSSAKAGTGQPPAKLVTQDVVVGKGQAAKLTNTVDVRYTGTLYSNGTEFDSSWSRGEAPTSFPLSGVVPGFAQGIAGMQPGGRRVIVIPPDQGYGNTDNGPIPAGSTLVFVVDLVGIS